jgi:hypothetical protein
VLAGKYFGFLGAAAKKIGVPPFKACDRQPGACGIKHTLIDLRLSFTDAACTFADENHFCILAAMSQEIGMNQSIIEN